MILLQIQLVYPLCILSVLLHYSSSFTYTILPSSANQRSTVKIHHLFRSSQSQSTSRRQQYGFQKPLFLSLDNVDDYDYDQDINESPIVDQDLNDSHKEDNDDEKMKSVLTELEGYKVPLASISTSDLPTQYIVCLPESDGKDFVMIDVPPFSLELFDSLQKFMEEKNGNIKAILITNANSVHDAKVSGMYSSPTSDLSYWLEAFDPDENGSSEGSSSGIKVIMHRLDIKRHYSKKITQVLDGYGPWAWDTSQQEFVESGIPLTVMDWDDDKIEEFMRTDSVGDDDSPEKLQEKIRSNEEGKQILAIYTPGHTSGSMSYVFPVADLVVSGFTIPSLSGGEESRLDYKGYITTNRGTFEKQVESASLLKDNYIDRFSLVLPSRGTIINFLGKSEQEKNDLLSGMIDQFLKVGKLYDSFGI